MFHRMRDSIRVDDPFAIWVEQFTITERDEQPVPADYNLRISIPRGWPVDPVASCEWLSHRFCAQRDDVPIAMGEYLWVSGLPQAGRD
jgi:hypothetical protein